MVMAGDVFRAVFKGRKTLVVCPVIRPDRSSSGTTVAVQSLLDQFVAIDRRVERASEGGIPQNRVPKIENDDVGIRSPVGEDLGFSRWFNRIKRIDADFINHV